VFQLNKLNEMKTFSLKEKRKIPRPARASSPRLIFYRDGERGVNSATRKGSDRGRMDGKLPERIPPKSKKKNYLGIARDGELRKITTFGDPNNYTLKWHTRASWMLE
jgi:hypothetical protein